MSGLPRTDESSERTVQNVFRLVSNK